MPERTSQSEFFQDLLAFRRSVDQAIDRLAGTRWFKNSQWLRKESTFEPAAELYIDDETNVFHCRVCLPGVELGDIESQSEGNVLKITGQRKPNRSEKIKLLHSEIPYGRFERKVSLAEGVDVENVTASYRNGLLEVEAPMIPSVSPRLIGIHTVPLNVPMGA
jgi:HSP20 family protein